MVVKWEISNNEKKEENNMNKKVNLVSPWMNYFHKLEAMFREDPAIKLQFNKEDFVIKIYVEGESKASALSQLLPESVTFGNVKLYINVIPANKLESSLSLFEKAFEGNPALSFVMSVSGASTNNFDFVVFKKEVVQYYDDNLGDINGIRSTLYQDLAKELFGSPDGVYYCTDKE